MRRLILPSVLVFVASTLQLVPTGLRPATVYGNDSSVKAAPSHGSDAQGEGFPPYYPAGTSGNAGNGFFWKIGMAQLFSSYDSIWFTSELTNDSDRRIIFHMTERPIVELMLVGKDSIRIPLRDGPALRMRLYDRTPEPLAASYRFRADLRGLVGKLEPGDYRLRLIWPSSGYAIEGLPGYETKELRSPVWNFRIQATDIGSAMKEFPKWEWMIKRKDTPNPLTAGSLPRGVFTNTLKEPCGIRYRPAGNHGEATRPPLNVPISLYRWVGKGQAAPVALAPTQEEPLWKLLPGESVEIALPDWKTDGDGIYYYMITVYQPIANANPRSLSQGMSDPFVIQGSTSTTKHAG